MTTNWHPPLEMDDALGWAARPTPSPAGRAAHAALEAQAKKTAAEIIDARARRFALEPKLLDLLDPDTLRQSLQPLSKLSPLQMRSRIAELIGEETMNLGGYVALNLRAAMVYAERLIEIDSGAHVMKKLRP